MGKYMFNMSCGHTAEREVADPGKYYELDREYYKKQGLCNACWDKLREQHRTATEQGRIGGLKEREVMINKCKIQE